MEGQVRRDIVHLAVERRPRVVLLVVLLEHRGRHAQHCLDAAQVAPGGLERGPVERSEPRGERDFLAGFLHGRLVWGGRQTEH